MTENNNTTENPILKRLQELKQETDYEFVLELIDIYQNETPKQIDAIATAIKEKNLPALKIAAHTLKGSSLNLGAKQLGALCMRLEEIAKIGADIPEGNNTSDIEKEFEAVKVILDDFKRSNSM